MRSNTAESMENGFLGSISASSFRNLLPRSMSSKKKLNSSICKTPKSNSENTPPVDPNIQLKDGEISTTISKQSKSEMRNSQHDASGTDSNREVSASQFLKFKGEVVQSDSQHEFPVPPDPPIKVVVRIRPVNDGEKEVDRSVKKISADELTFGDRRFSFDSVFDSDSKQEDIFKKIGLPLVKDALAGYNTSIMSYGQTGSGKTFTMWGPPSAMVENPSPFSNQGLAPRIFQMLFSEIQKEQENSEGKLINYQCRCSFMEIFNEQIGDLLDPTQRNLKIKDDPKNGLYVENVTEEYVTNYDDVTQILVKGLSSRKVGATTINSKSSRSHIVFTFIIESWCKETSSKCFGSSKTSRISLVDLAGLDRNVSDAMGRQSTRDGKNLKKSMSRLGHLIDRLAKETQLKTSEDRLYRGSCLTHLLRESLGGNAKLTVICAISPDNNYSGETLRTLRLGQRLKSIKNQPVINEIKEDEVNDLSDQIRLLKEELIKANANSGKSVPKIGYFQGPNVRESLNQLRVSINRSLILPCIDNDSDEEVNCDEEDVKELHQQIEDKFHSFSEEISDKRDSLQFSSVGESFASYLTSDDEVSYPQTIEEISPEEEHEDEHFHEDKIILTDNLGSHDSNVLDPVNGRSISVSSFCHFPNLEDPPLSESPKIGNSHRKSLALAPSFSEHHDKMSDSFKFNKDVLRQSSKNFRSSLQSSDKFEDPTESLAASLQRGLKIIDYHQQSSILNKSSVSFSFEHLARKSCPEVDKPMASLQTLEEENAIAVASPHRLCASCQRIIYKNDTNEDKSSLKTQVVAVNESNEGGELGKEIVVQERCEIKEVQEVQQDNGNGFSDVSDKEELLKEIQNLRSKLQAFADVSATKSTDKLRSSLLLSRSIQLRKSNLGGGCQTINEEELEKERERWTEMESEWISLTDELRVDLESIRQRAEKVELELKMEKNCNEELEDALQRSVLGHARFVEHYAELQEKHNELVGKHRAIMGGIADVKRAAEKAGSKGRGSRFSKSLAAELSALRFERDREREFLKKENKSLKLQLRDTAEAVHAAGELLVRLREAEHSASVAEEKSTTVEQENEKLKKQMEKLKRKHKMEMITMKQYLAESRLPASALEPLYQDHSDVGTYKRGAPYLDDDQAWRSEFGAIYQEPHY
ncbi:kinesin-like protein KIN-12F isoform X2 [Momordica charantia]|uniref:Kinesin-like protein KIN-12F isoform X2 n=1 Tax=Momordica charantia TaxID=3673 RepID=A0A6J1DTP4_MOMCH|nr:kinesin-like protein KIN-12F isoform X2 [Momordica charantia]